MWEGVFSSALRVFGGGFFSHDGEDLVPTLHLLNDLPVREVDGLLRANVRAGRAANQAVILPLPLSISSTLRK